MYTSVFNELKNGKFDNYGNFITYSYTDYARITCNRVAKEYIFRKGRVVPEQYKHPDVDYRWIKDFYIQNPRLDYITASDISSYVFCPASYCIKKTFSEVEENEEALIGTELHKKNRLLSLFENNKSKSTTSGNELEEDFYTIYNKDFFDDIKSSTIMYVGHNESSEKYFVSNKGRFFGQPDYVFTNNRGENFIVEEKFRSIKKEIRSLRENHKAQLTSYIIGLNKFEAKYGYLVYWYYVYERGRKYVSKCTVFRIDRSDSDQLEMRKIYKDIIKLNDGSVFSFDISRIEGQKCANCIVKNFCGHKTGRLNEISLPYDIRYFGLTSGGKNGWF